MSEKISFSLGYGLSSAKWARRVRFLPRLVVHRLRRCFVQDAFLDQPLLPQPQRIVLRLVSLDLFRRPVLLRIRIRDRMARIAVGIDLQQRRPAGIMARSIATCVFARIS